MRVRSVPVVDQLDREGERLVLLPERAVRLVGLAPTLLDLTTRWCELERLAEELEHRFGTPADGDAVELVRHAVRNLAAEGLVVIDEDEG